ncbi:MAG: hypothetical protein H0V18_09935 [Pyrinomonadaceae bacterium]|nr:hypothetical protein [Pyrinomonadaceae bacterium]
MNEIAEVGLVGAGAVWENHLRATLQENEGVVIGATQLEPEAWHRVARGKRLCAHPLVQVPNTTAP